MKNQDLNLMTVDQLCELQDLVVAQLNDKIAAEKASLEDRLRKLGSLGAKIEARRGPDGQVAALANSSA